jgi:hypothetical protein
VHQNSFWRHHYIPEFYLRQWAAKNGQLVEYSKPWGDIVKPKRVYPRQTGFEDRLNELSGLPEDTRQHLEKHFYSPVDNRREIFVAMIVNGSMRRREGLH